MRLIAILAVMVLMSGALPLPGGYADSASADSQEDKNSALKITRSDYRTPITEIHGEEALAYVVLNDPELSEPDVRARVPIEVTSGSDSVGIELDLLETGVGTGRFYGGFGFSTTASQSPFSHPLFGRIGIDEDGEDRNAQIEVEELEGGESITLRTLGAPDHNVTIKWFNAENAEIAVSDQFGEEISTAGDDGQEPELVSITGYGKQLNIVIQDPDLDQDKDRIEQYHDLLVAYSDSQPEGERVVITETGSDTGIFQTALGFEARLELDNHKIFVQEADRIHIEYREPHTPHGEEEVHRFPDNPDNLLWEFRESADGSIRTERSTYFGETDDSNLHGDDRAVIIIDDPGERHRDGSKAGGILVNVQSSQGSGTINATQLGSQDSKFIATLGFTFDDSAQLENLDDGEIPLLPVSDPKDTITVRYTDRDGDNRDRVRSHSFAWSRMEAATIQVGEGRDLFAGTEQDIVVHVQDLDSNENPNIQETVIVDAKSTSDAVNGLRVPLLETGLDTGVFTGDFRFTKGTTGHDALKVREGDQLVVEYRDRLTDDGSSQIVRSDVMYWREATQGEIRADLPDYYADFEEGNGGEFNTTAIISVQDKDRSHPLQRNQVEATAMAIDGGSVDITLREVGTDTGLFVGPLHLSSFLEDHLDDNPDGHVEFQLQYREPLAEGGTRLVETDRLKIWDAPVGDDVIIRFEHEMDLFDTNWAYPRDRVFMPDEGDKGDIAVAVYGSEGSWDGEDTLTARIYSEECSEPRDIELERVNSSNRFTINVVFTTEPVTLLESCQDFWDDDRLGVTDDGTVTLELVRDDGFTVVSYQAETLPSEGERISFVESDSSTESLPRTTGINDPVDIYLDRGNHGKYSGTQLFVETEVWSRSEVLAQSDEIPIVALLAETDDDSGEFRGAIRFTHEDRDSLTGSELGEVTVRDDADTIPQSGTPMYGLFDAVIAGAFAIDENGEFDGTEKAVVRWFPAGDAQLGVTENSFGSGGFQLRLVDGDGLHNRVTDIHGADEDTTEFATSKRYIPGTEHVYVRRAETWRPDMPGGGESEFTVDAAENAAEPIADRNRDGVVVGPMGCRDVDLSLSSGNSCRRVDAGEGDIVVFNDESEVDIGYMYRAARVNRCPAQPTLPNEDDNRSPFEYMRTSGGIRLCLGVEETIGVELEYSTRDRQISVRGPTETEEVTLSYSASLSNARTDGKSVFGGEIREETFRQSRNDRIHVPEDRTEIEFYYLDPALEVDGQPGSISAGHFRSNPVKAVWRDAEAAEVDVMTHDFNGPAGDFVYGSGVPVEVKDPDSSRFDRRDTITVEATGNENTMSVTLRETGRDTGVFRGVVPADTLMGEEAGSITVTYRDPQDSRGRPSLRSTVTDWRPATTAKIEVLVEGQAPSGSFLGPLAAFDVRITDTDANLNSNRLERIDARLVSESDPVGESIRLEETGPNTGEFVAPALRFETFHNPGSGRVFVQDGDKFWVTYVDPLTLDDGTQRVVESDRYSWNDANNGAVRFDRQFHVGMDAGQVDGTPSGLEKLARAIVAIKDVDRSTSDRRINVIDFEGGGSSVGEDLDDALIEIGVVGQDGQIQSAIEGIRFVESGHNTGEFLAAFSFSEDGESEEDLSGDSFASVPAEAGDFIGVSYADPDPLDQDSGIFDDEARWFPDGYGVVRFNRPGYGDFEDEPRLTVYDKDLEGQEEIEVTLSSRANPDGLTVTLFTREDSPGGGVFTASFPLSPTPTVRGLYVHDEDEIEVRFQDESLSRTAVHSALFIDGLSDPPETRLVTDPEVPDGENGWFTTQPVVRLETNRDDEHIETTFLRRDEGLVQEFDGTLTLGEGIHVFEYWSVDRIGNEEEPKTRTIRVSLTDPDAVVPDLNATSRPDGKIELNWSPVQGKLNPLEFGEYRVFRDSLRQQVGATGSETFTDLPPEDGDYTYYVYVANAAGRFNPDLTVTTSGVSDRVPPVVEHFEVNPTELHQDQGENTVTANLSVTQDTLDDVDEAFLRVIDPFGEIRHEVPMDQGDTAQDWQLHYSAFNISGMYIVEGVAEDFAGNEGSMSEDVRYFAEDLEPPRVTELAEEIDFKQDLNVTVRDNDRGVSNISYSIDEGPPRLVNISPDPQEEDHCIVGPCEVSFTISMEELVLGINQIEFHLADGNDPPNEAIEEHSVLVIEPAEDPEPPVGSPVIGGVSGLVESDVPLQVQVESETPLFGLTLEDESGVRESLLADWDAETGRVVLDVAELEPGERTISLQAINLVGTVTEEFTFFLLEPGIPLPPEEVTVSLDSRGRPVVDWTDSPSDFSKVGGYIIHRSASDWTVLTATDRHARSFVDTSVEENRDYQYVVTAFGADGEAYMDRGEDSTNLTWFSYLAPQAIQVESIEVIPPSLWWIMGLFGVTILAAGFVFVNRHRMFPQREPRGHYLGGDQDVEVAQVGTALGADTAHVTESGQYGETSTSRSGQEPKPDPDSVFSMERHRIQCPGCSNAFHANGQPPIITSCPNCGKRGILRAPPSQA